MSTLPLCPVACPLPQSKPHPVRSGISLLKLNKWKLPQARYFWIDFEMQEVRWSKNSRLAGVSFKRIPFEGIRKIAKVSKYRQSRAEHGFTIDIEGKSYVFRLETMEMRDKLVTALQASTACSENRPSLRSLLPASPPFTERDNQSLPPFHPASELKLRPHSEATYRSLLTDISLAVAIRPNPTVSQSPNFEDLPDTISRLMEANKLHADKLKTDIEKENEGKNTVQSLRKRLNMLEGHAEEIDSLNEENENLKAELERENRKYEKLQQQIGRLKEESEGSCAGEVVQGEDRNTGEELLKLGFVGYLCCFKEQGDANPQISEDSSYKKRYLSVSPDYSELHWRPLGIFSTLKSHLNLREITSVLSGTEEPETMQPFEGYTYLTVFTSNMTVIIAVEGQYEFYLTGIKRLFAVINSFPESEKSISRLEEYHRASNMYCSQVMTVQRQVKRWKMSLGESICGSERGEREVQEVYLKEIQKVRDIGEKWEDGDKNEYWKAEKEELTERVKAMEALVAALSTSRT